MLNDSGSAGAAHLFFLSKSKACFDWKQHYERQVNQQKH